jgi:hypothetical protein
MVSIALSHRLRFLSMCSAKVLAESGAACGFAQERKNLRSQRAPDRSEKTIWIHPLS